MKNTIWALIAGMVMTLAAFGQPGPTPGGGTGNVTTSGNNVFTGSNTFSSLFASGTVTASSFSGSGTGPTRFDMWDADHSNFMSEQANLNITGNFTNMRPAAAATGIYYGTNSAGVVTHSQIANGTAGQVLTMVSGIPAFAAAAGGNQTPITSDINYAQWSQTNILNISGGFTPQIRFSTNNLTVGIGKIPDNYGAGSLELLTDLVIGQDANIGRNAFISGSGYIGIGNRTAFRADGNGQLRIFAANNSTSVGLGADVFLGTTTATNGFITVTNSAQTLSAITFPLSTVKWTNNFGMNILLYIDNSGVTGTSVSKNNQQIFSSLVGDMTIGLKPGDYFAVAYTIGTPVARWEPQ